MEIDDFRNKKNLLETLIHAAVEKIVEEFFESTEYYPTAIEIGILNIQTIGGSDKPRFIQGVKTRFDILD